MNQPDSHKVVELLETERKDMGLYFPEAFNVHQKELVHCHISLQYVLTLSPMIQHVPAPIGCTPYANPQIPLYQLFFFSFFFFWAGGSLIAPGLSGSPSFSYVLRSTTKVCVYVYTYMKMKYKLSTCLPVLGSLLLKIQAWPKCDFNFTFCTCNAQCHGERTSIIEPGIRITNSWSFSEGYLCTLDLNGHHQYHTGIGWCNSYAWLPFSPAQFLQYILKFSPYVPYDVPRSCRKSLRPGTNGWMEDNLATEWFKEVFSKFVSSTIFSCKKTSFCKLCTGLQLYHAASSNSFWVCSFCKLFNYSQAFNSIMLPVLTVSGFENTGILILAF